MLCKNLRQCYACIGTSNKEGEDMIGEEWRAKASKGEQRRGKIEDRRREKDGQVKDPTHCFDT